MPSSQARLHGLYWAAVAIAVWSGSLVMLRLGVTTSLNTYDLTALRFGVAALVLAPVVLRRGLGLGRLGAVGLLTMVVGFGAPYVMLISLALRTAPASAAGALNPGVMAVASVFLARAVFGDRIGPVRSVGMVLILAGAAVVAGLTGTVSIGHLILTGTGVMWAAYALTVRRAGIPALQATAIVAVISAILYLPVYVMALPKEIVAAPMHDILAQAAFQGVLVSVVAVFAFNRSAEFLGPVAGATLPALIPLATLTISVMVLDEAAGVGEIASAAFIGVGVALVLAGRVGLKGPFRGRRPQGAALERRVPYRLGCCHSGAARASLSSDAALDRRPHKKEPRLFGAGLLLRRRFDRRASRRCQRWSRGRGPSSLG